jgi:hypothetical protein
MYQGMRVQKEEEEEENITSQTTLQINVPLR